MNTPITSSSSSTGVNLTINHAALRGSRQIAMPVQGMRGRSREEVSVLLVAKTKRRVSWADPSREDAEENKTERKVIWNNIQKYYFKFRSLLNLLVAVVSLVM